MADESDGYELTGYLTYTRYAFSGEAAYKRLMLFDVRVVSDGWSIVTEPVTAGSSGIAFHECSRGPNGTILMITGFRERDPGSEPSFERLRAELKESHREDLYFTSPMEKALRKASNMFPSPARSRQATDVSKSGKVTNVNNIAVALVLNGDFPPADPSFAALLAFAFTPPSERKDGSDKMLPQVWDDGNATKSRFRNATWGKFLMPPHLLSRAVFQWVGKELTSDGTWANIGTSDVSIPSGTAARYEVNGITNVLGLTLPSSFRLVRFLPKDQQSVSSTVVGSIAAVSHFRSGDTLQAKLPGKTVISDYRLARGVAKGQPLRYTTESNAPPSLQQLQQGKLYKRMLESSKASGRRRSIIRVVLMLAILLAPICVLLRKISVANCKPKVLFSTQGKGKIDKT